MLPVLLSTDLSPERSLIAIESSTELNQHTRYFVDSKFRSLEHDAA